MSYKYLIYATFTALTYTRTSIAAQQAGKTLTFINKTGTVIHTCLDVFGLTLGGYFLDEQDKVKSIIQQVGKRVEPGEKVSYNMSLNNFPSIYWVYSEHRNTNGIFTHNTHLQSASVKAALTELNRVKADE